MTIPLELGRIRLQTRFFLGIVLAFLFLGLLIVEFDVQRGVCEWSQSVTSGSLTARETDVVSLVSGSEAYSYDLDLESIALSHYAFRSAGSSGANEAAEWIASQFESFGLEVTREEFQFTTWDLLSEPSLIIDDDGDLATTRDQSKIKSFQSLHYSLPVDVSADLVVLPLPPAKNRGEVGALPIGALWHGINITGKVVLIGYEIRADYGWEETFNKMLRAQPPAAVIHTWWYDWMSYVPDLFTSAGGRPITQLGTNYFWESDVAAGFVNYGDGLFIRNRESNVGVSARVVIDSVVDVGPHYNIVGKLSGHGEPGKFVIVSGHYDSVMSAGFCDNGAGISGVVELARVFTEAGNRGLYHPKYTILFVAFAAEEIGLVGSINYVAQHKNEMDDIVAVVNLDCIGSDWLEVTRTDIDHGIDLRQIVFDASRDLGVICKLIEPGGSDQQPFLDPSGCDSLLVSWWGMSLGISDAHPVKSSCMLTSYPSAYYHGHYYESGWIHTSYDNSTSTETLNWVEAGDLEGHIKVAALSLMRVVPPCEHVIANFSHETLVARAREAVLFSASSSYSLNNITSFEWSFGDGNTTIVTDSSISHTYAEPGNFTVTLKVTDDNGLWNTTSKMITVYFITDLNQDGTVNIVDITIVAQAYGAKYNETDGMYWHVNPCKYCPHTSDADLNDDEIINILDISMVSIEYGKRA